VRIAAEAEAARVTIEAKGVADADVIKAEAHAAGIRAVATAVQEKGGQHAMAQRIAEMYIGELSGMAKNSKMMIVPEKPNDVAGVLTTALGISGIAQKAVGSAA